jgi:ER lumen protein retaining receptor
LRVFSLFLEAVAIVPQLSLLTSKGEAETITLHYLAALGSYRAFYILNWIYKYTNGNKVHWYSWLTGIVQTQLYLVFFYHYFTK